MVWQQLTRTLAPATPALSLATAKDHLRVEHEGDDVLIARLVEAATAAIEGPNGIGVALVTQTWRLSLDGYLPLPLELPLGPVQAVTGISYTDADGDTQTLDPALYSLDTDNRPARIVQSFSAPLPAVRRQLATVKVTFTAGYGTADAVPADLQSAMLLMVGHLYHHREAVDRPLQELPLGYAAITERYRVGRFG